MSNKDIIKIVKCYLKLNATDDNLCIPKINKRIRFTTSAPSHVQYQDKYKFKIQRISKVNGSMFQPGNWQDTNEKDPMINKEYNLFE